MIKRVPVGIWSSSSIAIRNLAWYMGEFFFFTSGDLVDVSSSLSSMSSVISKIASHLTSTSDNFLSIDSREASSCKQSEDVIAPGEELEAEDSEISISNNAAKFEAYKFS